MKLSIENLHATIDGTPILKGLNLEVRAGEIHAIMGPNGAGKSTLVQVLAGHPAYTITEGKILLDGQDITTLEPEERAKLGLFVAFQTPPEIPGVSLVHFLHLMTNSVRKLPLSEELFLPLLDKKMNLLKIEPRFKERHLNDGFSGGEKKRSEILQMALLDPKVALLDEIDSGLDVDAMRIIAEGINQLMTPQKSLILVTHYQRFLDLVRPQYVHVLVDGKIAQSGGSELALQLEAEGYG